METAELGQTALVGWREKIASAVAPPLAKRTPLLESQLRALVGALFFALSVKYVVGTVRRLLRQVRS